MGASLRNAGETPAPCEGNESLDEANAAKLGAIINANKKDAFPAGIASGIPVCRTAVCSFVEGGGYRPVELGEAVPYLNAYSWFICGTRSCLYLSLLYGVPMSLSLSVS